MICLHGHDKPEHCRQCPQDPVRTSQEVVRLANAVLHARGARRDPAGRDFVRALQLHEKALAEGYAKDLAYERARSMFANAVLDKLDGWLGRKRDLISDLRAMAETEIERSKLHTKHGVL